MQTVTNIEVALATAPIQRNCSDTSNTSLEQIEAQISAPIQTYKHQPKMWRGEALTRIKMLCLNCPDLSH